MELPAVIFPDTVLSLPIVVPLVPVFSPLVHLQPVENDPGTMTGPLATALLGAGCCRYAAPAPLGADRDRFLRLVSDLRTRRDDYAAQLGHQTLASISAASARRAETKSTIVGSLLAGHGIREEGDDRRRLLLWQARLLLKLAEMHAADQEELRGQLQRLREKEAVLFSGLREEEENPFAFSGELGALAADPSALRQQQKAWARLFVLGDAVSAGARVYISRNRDGFERLVEEYEHRVGSPPVHLGQLILPARYQDWEGLADQAQRFREEGMPFLLQLAKRFDSLESGSGLLAEAEQRAWVTLLEKFFPAAPCGRVRLTLVACPRRSPRRLFAEAFAPEEDELLEMPGAEPGIVLGVLEEGA